MGPWTSDKIVAGWSVDYASSTPELPRRPRRLVGHRGIRLFDQRRRDLDTVRHGDSGRRRLVHRRHDRGEHDAELHLGAGRRQPALLHAERRPDLESDHAARRHQLERFRLGLLSHGPRRSLPTACSPNTFYLILIRERACSRRRTAARAGPRSTRARLRRDAYNSEIMSVPGRGRQSVLHRRHPGQRHKSAILRGVLFLEQPGQDLDRHPQCARRDLLRLWRRGAGANLSLDLHRRIREQRLWGLAVDEQGPVVDADRNPTRGRTRPDHHDIGRSQRLRPSLCRIRRRRLRLSVWRPLCDGRHDQPGERRRGPRQHHHVHRQYERDRHGVRRRADAESERRRRGDLRIGLRFGRFDVHLHRVVERHRRQRARHLLHEPRRRYDSRLKRQRRKLVGRGDDLLGFIGREQAPVTVAYYLANQSALDAARQGFDFRHRRQRRLGDRHA